MQLKIKSLSKKSSELKQMREKRAEEEKSKK
jgi:hypothetical protein